MMQRTEAQAAVEDIRALWEVATPVAVIARKLHLPVRLVHVAIRDGQIPEPQPQWTTSAMQADGESKR